MMMNEFLPRMEKVNNAEFRQALKNDPEAQGVVESYSEKIKEWLDKLTEKAKATKTDVSTQYINFLDEKGCLGNLSLSLARAPSLKWTGREGSLSPIMIETR